MDARRLLEFEMLANAATPGPWKQGEDCMLLHDTGYCIADVAYYWNVNVPFIAAARTAIPELIAEVRRLSQRNHTCECSEDEACAHVRRAEKAEAEVERLQDENAKLKNDNERLYEAVDSPYTE